MPAPGRYTARMQVTAAPLAPRVDIHTIGPGTAVLPAVPDVRLRMHAGPPTRGACHGQRFVSIRGELDLIPPDVADTWQQSDASRSLLVLLSPALLRRAAEDLGRDPDRGLEFRHQFRDPQIEHIVWALDAERGAGHPSGPLYAESLGLALAARLLGPAASPPRPPTPRGLTGPQLARITDYIEAHLDDDLSLATLAAVAGISASHLKQQFRRSLGVPVHAYVIQRRVERARALLLGGRLPASQVALAAGFSHQSHMARCMRRVLGVTPTALARGAT
jgi:AraC family transcriptional regulator